MRQKQAEVENEAARKARESYRQLQGEAREKLFAVLTAEQRHKLETLLGPKFEFKPRAEGQGPFGAAVKEAQPGP